MSVVQSLRLARRRRYPGFMHQFADTSARAVEFTGAEWQQILAVDGLRLETVAGDPGALNAFGPGADLRYEIYEDRKAPAR